MGLNKVKHVPTILPRPIRSFFIVASPSFPGMDCGNATATWKPSVGVGVGTWRRSRGQLGSVGGELRRLPRQQARRADQRWDGRVLSRWVSSLSQLGQMDDDRDHLHFTCRRETECSICIIHIQPKKHGLDLMQIMRPRPGNMELRRAYSSGIQPP